MEEFKMKYEEYNIDKLSILYFEEDNELRKLNIKKQELEKEISNKYKQISNLHNLIINKQEEKKKKDLEDKTKREEENKKYVKLRQERRSSKIRKDTEERKKQEEENKKINNFL
jgi:hypothetical protein